MCEEENGKSIKLEDFIDLLKQLDDSISKKYNKN